MCCTSPTTSARPHRFPTLMAAAAATKTLRMGTFVLNACFYKPALLARDVQALRDLSDGRFELGLGAGYAQHEFEAAELRYPSARERIDYLAHVTEYMGEHLPDVPVLIAGNGDRLLTVAARQANIIGLTGGQPITEGPGCARRAHRLRPQRRRRPLRRPRAEHRDHRATQRRVGQARPVDNPSSAARPVRR